MGCVRVAIEWRCGISGRDLATLGSTWIIVQASEILFTFHLRSRVFKAGILWRRKGSLGNVLQAWDIAGR